MIKVHIFELYDHDDVSPSKIMGISLVQKRINSGKPDGKRINRPFCTVVCSVTWPLNGLKAGDDLSLIQNSLLLSYKCT